MGNGTDRLDGIINLLSKMRGDADSRAGDFDWLLLFKMDTKIKICLPAIIDHQEDDIEIKSDSSSLIPDQKMQIKIQKD